MIKQLILTFSIILLSCNSDKISKEASQSFIFDCDIVAVKEVINGDTVIVCDYNKIKQKKNVPLDELVSDFTILKMDNENDEGLIAHKLAGHVIGAEYIVIFSYSSIPVKLFDKQGRYIQDIGRFGQGPNEYGVINNVWMDEKADRIYVLAFNTDKVLVYDFEGNFYPSIPLPERVKYGNTIIVDQNKKELTVTQSPWIGNMHSVWIQDFEGNVLQGVKQSDYFSNEIRTSESSITRLQTSKIELFSLNGYNTDQYLYHFNIEENRLVPIFRMKNMDVYWIFVYELPNHYVVEVATSTSPGTDEYFTPKLIIDKHTLKGCFFDGFVTPEGIVLDQYDILFNARYGYFGLVDFGSNIIEKIEKVDKDKLSSKSRKELEKLQLLIEETDPDDDCSLLFYGKFKQ